jgi:Adenylate and Guanylate cyclase catalytic domain
MDYTAVGQTTHLAARMEQVAEPGTALMTPATLDLAEGYVTVRALGPVPIKGFTTPVEVYELMGAGVARSRLQATAARGLTRFVGRSAELQHLTRALELAGGGHGQVVTVTGTHLSLIKDAGRPVERPELGKVVPIPKSAVDLAIPTTSPSLPPTPVSTCWESPRMAAACWLTGLRHAGSAV